MKKSTSSYLLMTITFLLLLASCGPAAAPTAAAPTATIELTPSEPPAPAVHEGLADTLADFTLIRETEIASVVRRYRAIAQQPGFFNADNPSIKAYYTGFDPQALELNCAKTGSPCAVNMGSFSVQAQRKDGVMVTQNIVVIAFNNEANTDDPNEKVVVWAGIQSESPNGLPLFEPEGSLNCAHLTGARQRFEFQAGRNEWTEKMAFGTLFDDPEYAEQLNQMWEQRKIWNMDQLMPVQALPPAPR